MAGRKRHRTLLAIIEDTGGVEKIFEEIEDFLNSQAKYYKIEM